MLKLSRPNLGEEERAAADRVLRSGNLVQGTECLAFEADLARYLDVAEVIVCSSGTSALHLSLVALGIGQGDAVLVPDFTFAATANVVSLVGARPVFVDVDGQRYNITEETLQAAIETYDGPESLKAVMPVHEFGSPVDLEPVLAVAASHGLSVIEDAACAIGAQYAGKHVGTFGDTGCFSFHPRKVLTTGEGGAVCTNDVALATELRMLRNHGIVRSDQGIEFRKPGFNYRMTDIQAAIGVEQLRRLPEALDRRSALKDVYLRELSDIEGVSLPYPTSGHTWQTFMVALDTHIDRAGVIAGLRGRGFESNLGSQSMVSLDSFAAYRRDWMKDWHSPRLYRQGLALPFCEQYSEESLSHAAQALVETVSALQ